MDARRIGSRNGRDRHEILQQERKVVGDDDVKVVSGECLDLAGRMIDDSVAVSSATPTLSF